VTEFAAPEWPRVVATDLDGTLVRSDGTVSDRTRAVLARAQESGALVVFVTGRPPRWMGEIAEQTGHRGLAVCANGALVYDLAAERVVEEHPLEPVAALAVVQALRDALPGVAFAVEHGVRFGHEPAYHPRWPVGREALVAAVDELVHTPVAKLLARHDEFDADTLLARAREVAGELAELTHSSREGLVEISAAGVSKASTLELLVGEHGYAAASVVAFGDMPNDLPMLAWAGRAVAVANAHPDVIAAADEVTGSNDDDGVARVLERWWPPTAVEQVARPGVADGRLPA
jgi:Cof subfamily protein (haloacid dehalogenase superfamily)